MVWSSLDMKKIITGVYKPVTQGLILAAGRGSRMLGLTKDRPKGMIELGGKSLLQWQIDAMKRGGVDEIYLVGGYQIDSLKTLGYPCIENPLWNQTNMVESLKCADDVLSKKETIISYADIACSSEIFKILKKEPSDIAITYDLLWRKLWEERFANPLDDAETFSIREGKLRDIGRKPAGYQEIEGQYMGLIKLTPQGWDRIKTLFKKLDTKMIDMTTLLQALLQNGVAIQGIPISGKWCEADSPNDLKCYEAKLNSQTLWAHDWRS